MKEEIGIYIHIPFCASKCYYCDFCSFENKEDLIEKYIDALCLEILKSSEILSSYKIKTIYIGGGTPTYIDSKYIVKIMNILNMFVISENLKEVTIECNPNSLIDTKVKDYISCGINRFSLGLQTNHDNILKNIGRKHTFKEYLNALKILKENNVKNISTDLIYPLPNLTLDMFKDTVDTLLKLSDSYPIQHISIYNLELHKGTKLEFLISEGFYTLCDEDVEYNMKEYLESSLESHGFYKYEISNFCKKSFESKHNISYWKQDKYLGFGINAASFINGKRYSNTKNINDYIDFYTNNNYSVNIVENEEEMDKLNLMKEYIILNLRLTEGLNLDKFKSKFKINILDLFSNEITELKNKDLLYINDTNISLTKRGAELANIVWQYFI